MGYVMVGFFNKILRSLVLFSVPVEIILKKFCTCCVFAYTCVLLFVKRLYLALNIVLNHLLQAFNQNGLISSCVNFDI